MREPIKVGLSAFGKASTIFHAPLLHAHPNFILSSVVERTKENSRDLYPQVTIVRSFDELIADPDIELIVITTPNQLHFPQARQALEAGKHVVVDKPFTIYAEDAATLIEIAEKTQRVLSVFHNRRWDSDHQTVAQIIRENLLGDVVEYVSHFDRFRKELKPEAWRERDQPGAGILYDLGSHLIDQAVHLFGKPNQVFADVRTQRHHAEADDNFEIILYYTNLKVTLKAGMLIPHALPRLQVIGQEGSYVKYHMDVQEAHLKEGLVLTKVLEPEENWGQIFTSLKGITVKGKIPSVPASYLDYYSNIFKAIREGKELQVKPEEARLVIEIIQVAMQSHYEKRVISLPLD